MFDLLIPVSLNDSQITEEIQGNRASRRKKKLRPTEALTYSDLVVAMEQRAHTLGQPTQSVANLMSALRAFMEDFSFDADCPIGGSLRSSYYRHIAKHVDIITLAGRKGPYIANRRHLLGKWRSLVLELDRADAAERSAPTPFQNALREILAKCVSRKRVAKDAGISLATLGRWLSGALPNARAIPSIRRLENLFGLHPGALIELTQGKINAPGTTTGEIPAIAYRQRLAKSTSEHFVLKDASPALRNQWLSLVQHKTERLQNLQRQRNGRWSSTKESPKRETDRRWYCFINNEYVATADIYWSHVSSYLGWLMRADNQHKLDCTQETVQTMAWLIAPAGLELYVKWRIKRAGGAAHAGITGFLKFVRSLTHPRTGFFTQTPQFAKSLPQHMQPDDWAIFCQKTFEWVKTTLMALSDRDGNDDEDVENTSRDSFLPIQAVLGLANPMEAVSDMLVRMKSVRPATGGQFEAVWHRDLLLIKILASNSLRVAGGVNP